MERDYVYIQICDEGGTLIMNKEQFLIELASALAGLPEEDIERSLEFYSEMIDDRIEDGLSEEEAVAALGSIDEIRAQIIKDTPLSRIVRECVKPTHKPGGFEIALLIIGFPIWFPRWFLYILL